MAPWFLVLFLGPGPWAHLGTTGCCWYRECHLVHTIVQGDTARIGWWRALVREDDETRVAVLPARVLDVDGFLVWPGWYVEAEHDEFVTTAGWQAVSQSQICGLPVTQCLDGRRRLLFVVQALPPTELRADTVTLKAGVILVPRAIGYEYVNGLHCNF